MSSQTLVLLFLAIRAVAALKMQTDKSASIKSGPSRWVLASENHEVCTAVCAREGLLCNQESQDKQTALDTGDKFKAAISEASGGSIYVGVTRPVHYSGSPFYHQRLGWGFYFADPSHPTTDAVSQCDYNDYAGHYPLCWCVDPATAGKAGGDPHLLNIKGERFNVHRQGYAPLVSIASEGVPHLEVVALIDGVKKCTKKMFITSVNSSGSWLEKNVAVSVRGQEDDKAFRVSVDGQEVWSPASRGYQPPAMDNKVFNHADKFSINEISAKATGNQQPGIELKTAHDVKMKIVRPLHRPTAPPHLNFDIQGLKTLPTSFKLGGLLGEDDHSYWSTRNEDCGTKFAQDFGVKEDQASSVASAH